MAMNMDIYHGRNTVEEEMQDWGVQGPILSDITRMRYRQGHVYLEFGNNQAAIQCAKQSTKWTVIDPPCYGSRFPEMVMNFSYLEGLPEFVRIDDEGHLVYYADFKVRCSGNGLMQMRLAMEKSYSRLFPGKAHELVITDILEMHFRYGSYELVFANQSAAAKAQAQTGWEQYLAPYSLEMSVKANHIEISSDEFSVCGAVEFAEFDMAQQ